MFAYQSKWRASASRFPRPPAPCSPSWCDHHATSWTHLFLPCFIQSRKQGGKKKKTTKPQHNQPTKNQSCCGATPLHFRGRLPSEHADDFSWHLYFSMMFFQRLALSWNTVCQGSLPIRCFITDEIRFLYSCTGRGEGENGNSFFFLNWIIPVKQEKKTPPPPTLKQNYFSSPSSFFFFFLKEIIFS